MQLVNNSIAPGSLAKRFPPPEVVRILGLGKKGDDRREAGQACQGFCLVGVQAETCIAATNFTSLKRLKLFVVRPRITRF
jgi:hypothetical protein